MTNEPMTMFEWLVAILLLGFVFLASAFIQSNWLHVEKDYESTHITLPKQVWACTARAHHDKTCVEYMRMED